MPWTRAIGPVPGARLPRRAPGRSHIARIQAAMGIASLTFSVFAQANPCFDHTPNDMCKQPKGRLRCLLSQSWFGTSVPGGEREVGRPAVGGRRRRTHARALPDLGPRGVGPRDPCTQAPEGDRNLAPIDSGFSTVPSWFKDLQVFG